MFRRKVYADWQEHEYVVAKRAFYTTVIILTVIMLVGGVFLLIRF